MEPKLRFKEFSGNWEKQKIKDITTYVDYRGKTPQKTSNGIFLVTAKNIKDGYIDYDCSKEYISESDFKDVMSRGIANIGDVLITTEAPCGNVAQVDRSNIALAQRVIKLSAINNIINNTYLKYKLLSSSFQYKLDKFSTGGTVKGIKGSVLHKMDLEFPALPEQSKIGSFLLYVDEKIQNQQDKINHLENIKKGFMQKLFSRKMRFKDDYGNEFPEWEKKKLKDCCEYKSSSISTSMILENGEYELFDANGKIGYTNTFCDKKYISIIKDGAGVGRIRILPKNSFCISTMGMIISNECSIIEYLYYMMSQLNFTKYIVGGAIPHIYFKDYGSEKIGIPCLEEQQKIADFLLSFDEKIDVEKDTLEHLKEMKKGLLQQMFV